VLPTPGVTPEDVAAFNRDGFLLLREFYDVETEIAPIREAIYRIIGLVIRRHDLPIEQQPYAPETFDSGYLELIAHDRAYGGEVYDAVKNIPAFLRLLSSERNEHLVRTLRNSDTVGIAWRGFGIRIDNPAEQKFLSPWHQEYPAHMRSLDGIIVWSPLRAVTPELGPVQFCAGSHRAGLFPMVKTPLIDSEHIRPYATTLENEREIVDRYQQAAPLSQPGDVFLVDYLTLHASSPNLAPLPRWSMQFRYFNFNDPVGISIGWSASFAEGRTIEDIHPELIVGTTTASR
jgi:hypothetical protein